MYINQALLKRGGGQGRPDFTIVFKGGGGAGKKSLKPYEESILHCKKKKRNKLARTKEKLDQRKLEVIQPKIKDKSNLRLGVFFFGKSKKVGGP